jgi:hypothetical protein
MNLKGLTDQQVKESREKHGTNSLTEKERESFLDKLKENLKDPMIKILIFALIISSIFAMLGKADWIETLGILFAISATTYISTWSEYKNENTFAKLQEEASKIMVKVMRNGVLTEVKIDDLVVGDIIKLQNGELKFPVFMLFITDGDNYDKTETQKILRELSNYDIYIQFVGIGNDSFNFLKSLDNLYERKFDNAGFIQFSDLKRFNDNDIYDELLKEFIDIYKKNTFKTGKISLKK